MTMFLEDLADPAVLPRVTEVNRGFYEAAAAGSLVVRRCDACGLLFHYPRPYCPTCHSSRLSWTPVSGEGTVRVAAPVYRPAWDDLPRGAPYIVVLVQLDEGPQLLSTLERCVPSAARAGVRVRAAFERVGELGLVRFVPADPGPDH
jgi:uncharacterized OB-fold protein